MLPGVANISSIFFFGSLFLYLKVKTPISADLKLIMRIGSVVLAVLAFFTYDITLTLPLVLIFYDLCFYKLSSRGAQATWRSEIASRTLAMTKSVGIYLPYFAVMAFYLSVRIGVVGFTAPEIKYLAGSFYYTLLVIPEVFVRYIWLLFFPLKLAFFHSLAPGVEVYTNVYTNFDAILTKTILSLDVLVSLFALIFIVGIAIFCLRRKPLITFCIGWFFITLLPVSGIIPVGPLMVERYLYLASFGFVLLLAYFLLVLLRRIRPIGLICLIGLIGFYGVRTYVRNFDWRTPKTFWASQVRVYPRGLMGHFNLALYYSVDEPQKAIDQYSQILKIDPRIWETYHQRGIVFLRYNSLENAEADYLEVLKYNPDFLDAYINLGSIYASEGRVELAVDMFLRGLRINKDNNKFFGNLPPEEEVNFGFARIYNSLGQIYEKEGKFVLASESFREALIYLPGNVEIEGNLNRVDERRK